MGVSETLELFLLLANHKVDFSANMDTDGCSALITAIVLDWPLIVQLLIGSGVDIFDEGMPKVGASVSTDLALQTNSNQHANSQDRDRFIFSKGCSQCVSPLLCATMLRRHAIVDILLASGADCQQTSCGSFWRSSNIGACSVCDVRVSPVHIAAYHGDVGLLQRFLEVCKFRCLQDNRNLHIPISCSHCSEEDITPLWLALLRGEKAAVKLLLAYDYPRAPPCHFGSGLHIALEEGHLDLAKTLLRCGYNILEDLEWIESRMFPTSDREMIDFIEDIANKPASLFASCRNALLCHMGPRLSEYLAAVNVPQKVVDVLLLKDILGNNRSVSDDVHVHRGGDKVH